MEREEDAGEEGKDEGVTRERRKEGEEDKMVEKRQESSE